MLLVASPEWICDTCCSVSAYLKMKMFFLVLSKNIIFMNPLPPHSAPAVLVASMPCSWSCQAPCLRWSNNQAYTPTLLPASLCLNSEKWAWTWSYTEFTDALGLHVLNVSSFIFFLPCHTHPLPAPALTVQNRVGRETCGMVKNARFRCSPVLGYSSNSFLSFSLSDGSHN